MFLKNNELIYFINYFFLKNLNVNLFMCLHLETNSSCVLSSKSGSPLMIGTYRFASMIATYSKYQI